MSINNYTVAEVLSKLRKKCEEGYLFEKTHPDYPQLSLFNYTPQCTFEKAWDDISLHARGLIIDTEKLCYVAMPFPKFFNYGEGYLPNQPAPELPKSPFVVTEKLDGSLGIAYFYDNQWHVATRGSFNSDQAVWATKWLRNNPASQKMNPGYTHLFEIIYPENKIVVNYNGEESLYLLSMIYPTFAALPAFEAKYADLVKYAQDINLKVAPQHQHSSIDELLEVAKTLSHNKEGFVVAFRDEADTGLCYRIKIKGDEYCRVHRLISNVTPLRVWESLMNGDHIDLVRKDLPEEILKDFNSIVDILENKYEDIIVKANNLNDYFIRKLSEKKLDEKEYNKAYALLVQKDATYNGIPHNIMYCLRDDKPEDEIRKVVYKTFKPENNKLEGYTPSNVMNRFEEG